MRECENEELRDVLPAYAAGRLANPDRARVAEHITACADCAAEVELLRAAHQAMSQDVPRIDVARIVAALPAPPRAAAGPVLVRDAAGASGRAAARRPARASGLRPMWTGWRIAAAVSTIAVGGLSVAVLRDLSAGHATGERPAVVASAPVQNATAPASTGPVQMASADAGLAVGGGLSDLSDAEMEGLLKDLDGIEASPSDEPDAAAPGLHAAVAQPVVVQ